MQIETNPPLPKPETERLLSCAYYASTYWCEIIECEPPEGAGPFDTSDDRFICSAFEGRVRLRDLEDDSELVLDADKLRQGWRVFVEQYPRHLADLRAKEEDGNTGDAFLQCCLFGERVYA